MCEQTIIFFTALVLSDEQLQTMRGLKSRQDYRVMAADYVDLVT